MCCIEHPTKLCPSDPASHRPCAGQSLTNVALEIQTDQTQIATVKLEASNSSGKKPLHADAAKAGDLTLFALLLASLQPEACNNLQSVWHCQTLLLVLPGELNLQHGLTKAKPQNQSKCSSFTQ